MHTAIQAIPPPETWSNYVYCVPTAHPRRKVWTHQAISAQLGFNPEFKKPWVANVSGKSPLPHNAVACCNILPSSTLCCIVVVQNCEQFMTEMVATNTSSHSFHFWPSTQPESEASCPSQRLFFSPWQSWKSMWCGPASQLWNSPSPGWAHQKTISHQAPSLLSPV